MTDQLLENTILLFVAVDPIALIPIFASLTKGLKNQEIKKIYIQATFVSLIILSLFWLFGETVLNLMGISMSSFRIIGGLFLIAIAFQMVFEQRQDRKPQLSDLRESGAIEQDADVVIFLYRPWVYSQEDEDEGKAEIIVAKQRNGPTGKVDATFIKQYARFENLSDQETPF